MRLIFMAQGVSGVMADEIVVYPLRTKRPRIHTP